MIFSIIVPAYNEEKYITPCLKSISLLKVPIGASSEVIVVNNASTDRTAEVARAALPEAKIINEPHKGLTRAYNRGAKEAKGEILVFVDADMVLPPDHLKRISKEFQKDPQLVAISGPYIYKDLGKYYELLIRCTYLFLAIPAEMILNRFLNLGAAVASGNSAIRKDAFQKIGGFNEELFYALEPDMGLRIRKLGKVRYKYSISAESSARRLKKAGAFKSIARYALDGVWLVFLKKPFPRKYVDIR